MILNPQNLIRFFYFGHTLSGRLQGLSRRHLHVVHFESYFICSPTPLYKHKNGSDKNRKIILTAPVL